MGSSLLFFLILLTPASFAQRPSKYLGLLEFVQPAPDQGETGTCLFVASTGALELLANRKDGIRNPRPFGKYDLAESFAIHAYGEQVFENKSEYEYPVLGYNIGYGIHISHWPFEAWRDGTVVNELVWSHKNTEDLPKTSVPRVDTEELFSHTSRHATGVLDQKNIEMIKDSLWKYKTPILANYVDDGFWHAVLIVGYDDHLPGECYEISKEDCQVTRGSFYVRDSFGVPIEVRDYDWFRMNGNAAFIVKEVP